MNDLRARHGAPPLTFDYQLAIRSQQQTDEWEYDDNYVANWPNYNTDWISDWGPMWPVNTGNAVGYIEHSDIGHVDWIVLVPRTQAGFSFKRFSRSQIDESACSMSHAVCILNKCLVQLFMI